MRPWNVPQTFCSRECQKWTCPFTVDAHFGTDVNATARDLWNVLHPFHVCGVAAGSKDDSDLGFRIHIARSDERPSRIVDQRRQLNAELLRYLLST